MNYRADIDGLRAIAVLVVVIFHLGVAGFEGGFVGVDIFFVISGYLITMILKHKIENGHFNLSAFYLGRIRRLIPPLLVTILVTLIFSIPIMTPFDLEVLSKSALAAILSLSNVLFYSEAGYWDTASELKPLLHTWSLGVEEQFYIFWPVLVLVLLSIRRSIPLGVSLGLITIFGAVLCVWVSYIDQSAAFYLLPFRVFQFAAGASLIPLHATLQARLLCTVRMRQSTYWLGLLLIGLGVLLSGKVEPFPGWVVLLPTAGAAMVLLAGALDQEPVIDAGLIAIISGGRLSLWFGRVSYSMYLVHWPIISLYRYHYGQDLESIDQVILAALTLFATLILHHGVEKKFYRRNTDNTHVQKISNVAFALRTFAAALFLAVFAAILWRLEGGIFPWKMESIELTSAKIKNGQKLRLEKYSSTCSVAGLKSEVCNLKADRQVLVIGDSHEPDGFNSLSAGYGQDQSVNLIVFGGFNKCKDAILESTQFVAEDDDCQSRLDALFSVDFYSNLDVVYYSALRPYGAGHSSILSVIRHLKELKPTIEVITQGGFVKTKRHCSVYISRTGTADSCLLPENVAYFAANPERMPLYDMFRKIEAHYVDRVSLLCRGRESVTCMSRTKAGIPAFYDKSHLSLEFAEMTGSIYAKSYPRMLHGEY